MIKSPCKQSEIGYGGRLTPSWAKEICPSHELHLSSTLVLALSPRISICLAIPVFSEPRVRLAIELWSAAHTSTAYISHSIPCCTGYGLKCVDTSSQSDKLWLTLCPTLMLGQTHLRPVWLLGRGFPESWKPLMPGWAEDSGIPGSWNMKQKEGRVPSFRDTAFLAQKNTPPWSIWRGIQLEGDCGAWVPWSCGGGCGAWVPWPGVGSTNWC